MEEFYYVLLKEFLLEWGFIFLLMVFKYFERLVVFSYKCFKVEKRLRRSFIRVWVLKM